MEKFLKNENRLDININKIKHRNEITIKSILTFLFRNRYIKISKRKEIVKTQVRIFKLVLNEKNGIENKVNEKNTFINIDKTILNFFL